jgi:hypothetical protein
MAVTFVAAAVNSGQGTTATAAVTSPAYTLPSGTAIGDRVYISSTSVGQPTCPADWTEVCNVLVGGGTLGASTGPRYLMVAYRDRDTAWAMPTVTAASTASNTIVGSSASFRKEAGESWDTPTVAIGQDTTVDVTFRPVSIGSLVTKVGASIWMPMAFPATAGAHSAQSITHAGTTFGTIPAAPAIVNNVTGHDASTIGRATTVTASSGASGTITWQSTIATARAGGIAYVHQGSSVASITIEGTGDATASSTGLADGKAVRTGLGDATAASTGLADGKAIRIGTGQASALSTGAADGRAIVVSRGAGAGTASATGVGAGAPGVPQTITGAGAATAASTGLVAGGAVRTGAGGSTAASTGAGPGSAVRTGAGAGSAASTGAGAGVRVRPGTGGSTASSTAEGTGQPILPTATGFATASSTGAGTSRVVRTGGGGATSGSTGSAAGSRVVRGVGGASTASSTAAGAGGRPAYGSGASTASSTGTGSAGKKVARGAGAATATSTATGTGVPRLGPKNRYKIGTASPTKIYVGTGVVDAIYQGDTLVWP